MKELITKNLKFRLAEVDDADFILKLRLEKGSYLSQTNSDVATQVQWLLSYKIREKNKEEYYFVISHNGENVGVVRVYNLTNNSFEWGSWILKNNLPFNFALESVLLIYDFGFNHLGLSTAFFDVRKENKKVLAFHKMVYKARLIKENELDYFFSYDEKSYVELKEKYKDYLCDFTPKHHPNK